MSVGLVEQTSCHWLAPAGVPKDDSAANELNASSSSSYIVGHKKSQIEFERHIELGLCPDLGYSRVTGSRLILDRMPIRTGNNVSL